MGSRAAGQVGRHPFTHLEINLTEISPPPSKRGVKGICLGSVFVKGCLRVPLLGLILAPSSESHNGKAAIAFLSFSPFCLASGSFFLTCYGVRVVA